MKKTISLLALALGIIQSSAQITVADFETFTLAPNSAYQSTNSIAFQTSNAIFPYKWNTSFGGYWESGFAYTNKYDSATAGFGNLYGVKPLKGYNNSNMYLIAQDKAVIKLKAPFDTFDGFYITNGTYAYKSIKNGDFVCRKFGDTTGTGTGTTIPQGSVADYFSVTTKGYYNGIVKTDTVTFFLADFRFANNAQDYIVSTWQYVNTSALGQVDSVKFFMNSSDKGQFGINTPLFFGIDNVGTSDNYVGIDEENLNFGFNMYPNPATNNLLIEIADADVSKTECSLLNVLGDLLCKQKLNEKNNSINLEMLSPGIYFIEMDNGKSKTIKKLIKE